MPILDPFMSFLASRFLFLTRFLSLLLLLLLLPICTSIKTISSTSPLRDGDVLISNGGNFALGFFSLNNSTNRYVGIWYNKVSERTIVWVANRDNPVRNISSGVLSVDDNYGNLILRDGERNVVVWSTNVSATARINFLPTCQLLNSGNLVLFGSEDGVAAWQSFDYPTDTVLPNMKVGWDRRTSLNRFVTSWKSDDDPATGDYSFKMNFVGLPQEILYQGVTPIWRTGTWTGIGWSGVPDMTPHGAGIPSFIFNVSYVNNEDEASIVWGILNGSNIFSRLVLRSSGSVERLTWHQDNQRWVEFWSAPRDKCDNYNHCGSFGYCDPSATDVFECNCLPGFEPKSSRDWFLRDGSGGCARVSGAPMCKNEEGFVTMPRVKVPDMTSTTRVDMRVETLKACEEMCLSNCSCLGYASGNISEGNGCITWHGDMLDIRQFPNGGQDFYIRADAAEVARYSKKTKRSHRLPVLVAVALSVAAVISLLSVAVWLTKKRRAKRRQGDELFIFNNRTSLGSPTTTRKNRDESRANVDVQMFDLSTLVAATYNFSPDNKLGEGGFGSVYKGQLRNGEEIGVKRLSAKSAQGIQEFKNEITLIAKLQHRNLVRLLGCCVQREERMLVYEYLQNKGLDCFIFDRDKAALLDWQRRFQIILGIVRGLLYLHQDSRFRIIHRDLKSSNILLDGDLNPKISDFGMARIFGGDQVEAKTARVVGTYGYMSPEYAMEGLFSIKSDVFSLGVLLLEIVSGRRNNSYYEQSSMNLIGHVWELWSEGNTMDIVDSSMGDSYDAREVTRCIHVALLCVQELPANRPTMPEVAHMLCNDMKLRSPLQPAFVLRESNYVITDRSSKMGTISINEATMSVVEAR